MTTRRPLAFLSLLLALAAGACDRHRGMEVRTFELSRMSVEDASSLLTPYVREGGLIAGRGQVLTVRETPERLAEIEKLLQKYDGEPATVSLRFQVIEANGFTAADTAIADVERTLRGLFRFRGYRLAREVTVRTLEGEEFHQAEEGFRLAGTVRKVRQVGNERRVPVELTLTTARGELKSTVNATLGRTLVLGSQQGGTEGALILVVRPELAAP